MVGLKADQIKVVVALALAVAQTLHALAVGIPDLLGVQLMAAVVHVMISVTTIAHVVIQMIVRNAVSILVDQAVLQTVHVLMMAVLLVAELETVDLVILTALV